MRVEAVEVRLEELLAKPLRDLLTRPVLANLHGLLRLVRAHQDAVALHPELRHFIMYHISLNDYVCPIYLLVF